MGFDWQQLLSAAAAELQRLQQRLEELEARVQGLIEENRQLREQLLPLTGAEPTGCPTASPAANAVLLEQPMLPPGAQEENHSSEALVIDPSKLFRGQLAYASTDQTPGVGPESESVESGAAHRGRADVSWWIVKDDELPLIEQRCRLKAKACFWAEERQRSLQQPDSHGAEVETRGRELIAQARQIADCYLWMCHHVTTSPVDRGEWSRLAACYEVLAESLALVQHMLKEEPPSERLAAVLEVVAEAQSALRVAVTQLGCSSPDHDQTRVFNWLRRFAAEKQLFLPRYMRLDDPADPRQMPRLYARLATLRQQVEDYHRRQVNRRKLLSRVRYKLTQLEDATTDDQIYIWQTIAQDIDELVRGGLPPSDVNLRELLLPYHESFPELAGMTSGFQLVVREIDRYLASLPEQLEEQAVSPDGTIELVASRLAGRAVVLIGGDRRPHAAEALQKAFQLADLYWIETRSHESTGSFEPFVARPEVVLVLLAIRWSSHSYGEVQEFCRRYDKPLVRLPGGYNPRQVAVQIREQCGLRLDNLE